MNSTILQLTRSSEGRYLDSEELYQLQHYLHDLPVRIQVYHSFQKNEKALLDSVISKLQPTMPFLTQKHGAHAWQRCRRDLVMVWRYCSMAMLLEDEDFLRDKLLYWFETITKSLKMRQHCHSAYRVLMDSLRDFFTEDQAKRIRPYLMLAQTMLTD